MEVMGGATFIDGDWESICRILSFDQDSDIANSISQNGGETLIELLMGNSNHSTSQCELDYPFNYTNHQVLPTPLFSYNLSSLSSDLSIGLMNNGGLINANEDSSQFVQPFVNDDDQISSLTSSSLVSKKRPRSMDNRKMQPKKSKIEASQEEERKSSSESSDNESNGSHELINEEAKEIAKLNGKKRANRGGATDPQSLYARKRRERINERLRILQNLVPNGTKVDISTMLEEAVSYVKFLQMQIKLLSSDDMWMYAPLAYNGFDVGHYNSFSSQLPRL